MYRIINALLELQKIDTDLDEVNAVLNRIPQQLETLDDQILAEQQELASVEEDIELNKSELTRLKIENKDELDRIRSYDKRLKELKTNREYQAILREIGFSKKVAAETEAEMEAKRLRIKELGVLQEEVELKIIDLKEKRATVEKQGDSDNSELSATKDGLEKNRASSIKELPADAYGKYQLVRKRTSEAIVTAQSGRCSGCNMVLPPQLFNRLLRGSEMISCPSCYRVLYVDRETEES